MLKEVSEDARTFYICTDRYVFFLFFLFRGHLFLIVKEAKYFAMKDN